MIIVSQDKKTIINFDGITRISIIPPTEEGYKYSIAINGCLDLGYYNTKERAKEVLQEIEKAYSSIQILPFLHISALEGFKGKDLAELTAYKMPEE